MTEASAKDLLPVAARRFGEAVHAVPHDRWGAQSACADWSVSDVVNHLTGEHRWAVALLAGETVEEVGSRYDGDQLGEDPVGAWDDAISASLTAWSQVHDDMPVHLSFGDTPAGEYARQMLGDLTVHAWDVARGAGLPERLEPSTVCAVLSYAQQHERELAGSGLFGSPVDVDSDDPQDRLLALLGRDPR